MTSHLPRAARTYLEQLRRELGFLPPDERTEVIGHTRAQIAALPGRGRRRAELLGALGTPAVLAARFTPARPQALKVSSGRYFLTRILAWPIFALALLTAALLVLAPDSLALLPPEPSTRWLGPLAALPGQLQAHIGSWILLAALLPLLLSLLPLLLHGMAGLLLQLFGALVVSAAAVLGAAGPGAYLAPLALLLWAQVFTPLLMMRGSMARPGPAWLLCAAAGLLAVLGFTGYQGAAGFTGPPWLVIAPVALMAVLALALPTRWRWAHIALIVAGLLVLVAGVAASSERLYHAPLLWPWLAGATSFAVGHLALAAGMWHERARNLLALL